MKISDKDRPIKTIPKGVWESSRPAPDDEKPRYPTETTDLQGNGYPQKRDR